MVLLYQNQILLPNVTLKSKFRRQTLRLLQKFITYRQKSFTTLAPGGQNSHLHLNVVHFRIMNLCKSFVILAPDATT
jgi:hypothetical protein